MSRKLSRSFYNRPTLEVARDVLGRLLVFQSKRGRVSAQIVEVEAYIGRDDPACHAAVGETKRNRVMYGQPGRAYVYFIYGMYYCFNIVTETAGFPAAVLVRAAEPVEGLDIMRSNSPKGNTDQIISGPGKLCRGLGITTKHTGCDLLGREIYLTDFRREPSEIICTTRIGIRKGTDLPYRFYLADSTAVSGIKPKTLPTRTT